MNKKMKKVFFNGSSFKIRIKEDVSLDKLPSKIKNTSFKTPKSLKKLAKKIFL